MKTIKIIFTICIALIGFVMGSIVNMITLYSMQKIEEPMILKIGLGAMCVCVVLIFVNQWLMDRKL